MAIGMWRARYWAVLGFQTVLLLMMLASAFGLVVVNSVLQAIGTTLLLLGSGTLFYFLIRAMARIQMPSPPATSTPEGGSAIPVLVQSGRPDEAGRIPLL